MFVLSDPLKGAGLRTGTSAEKGHRGKKNFRARICAMAAVARHDITGLLAAWGEGDDGALNRLMPIVYQELRRIARKHLAGQPPWHTLESAALVNEAYLKLLRADGIRCEGRLPFFALCAQIIRRIVVDHARSRQYGQARRRRGTDPNR